MEHFKIFQQRKREKLYYLVEIKEKEFLKFTFKFISKKFFKMSFQFLKSHIINRQIKQSVISLNEYESELVYEFYNTPIRTR